MSASFLKFPSELRNRVYELCLLQKEPIDPRLYFLHQHELTLGLLRVNKAVHREASSLFYAENCFDFTTFHPEDVASFLGTIGPRNAGYIRHLYVNFPRFLSLEMGDITLEEGSISILENIQSSCTNLSTLKTSLYSTNIMELRLDAQDSPEIVADALTLVNTCFRAILSLEEISVEVYKDGPSDDIRREMKSHGWIISATEHVEEGYSDRFFGDYDDWDHDYGCDDDDYDIDNDSDFWRRAAD